MILMLLEVPSFPAVFFFHFVSLSSRPSFVIILCFVLFFLLVFSSHFVSSWLFPSVQVSFPVFTLFFFYYFRYALPFILYSDILFPVTAIWAVGCKMERIFKEVSVFTEISGCQLLSGMKRQDIMCSLISILHIFCLDFKLSPCSLCSMFSFGYFPGVWGLKADVSEPSIGSIFIVTYLYHLPPPLPVVHPPAPSGYSSSYWPCQFPATTLPSINTPHISTRVILPSPA